MINNYKYSTVLPYYCSKK